MNCSDAEERGLLREEVEVLGDFVMAYRRAARLDRRHIDGANAEIEELKARNESLEADTAGTALVAARNALLTIQVRLREMMKRWPAGAGDEIKRIHAIATEALDQTNPKEETDDA